MAEEPEIPVVSPGPSRPSTTALTPGVEGPSRPRIVHSPHELVRTARKKVIRRDLIDGLILLLVDFVVLYWSDARLPFVSRSNTVLLLVVVHLGVVCYWYISRKAPLWRAKRIAATWSPSERERFRT